MDVANFELKSVVPSMCMCVCERERERICGHRLEVCANTTLLVLIMLPMYAGTLSFH